MMVARGSLLLGGPHMDWGCLKASRRKDWKRASTRRLEGLADGRGTGELPEPLEVVGGGRAVDGGIARGRRDEVVGVGDLGAGGRRCEEDGGEMEAYAHGRRAS